MERLYFKDKNGNLYSYKIVCKEEDSRIENLEEISKEEYLETLKKRKNLLHTKL